MAESNLRTETRKFNRIKAGAFFTILTVLDGCDLLFTTYLGTW